MYHGYNVNEQIIPSECCQAESRWLDCAECAADGYGECSVLICTECGATTNDHAEQTTA